MTTSEFLSYLRSKEFKLWIDGDKLCYSAPVGALTADLTSELAERKTEILKVLRTVSVAAFSIPRISRTQNLPLSFAQQRLWFLDQFEPESPFYNIAKAMRLNGPLNMEALQKSLDAILSRHEILRTNIAVMDGNPAQVITDNRSVKLSLINVSQSSNGDRQAEMHRLINAEARRPFNLSSDLMLRATLLQLDETDHVLLLVTHHIASDAWSMGVLLRELATLYEAFCHERPSPLPDLPIQYADFAVWQRQRLMGKILEVQLSYWKRQLLGVPVLELSTDRPRPPVQTFLGARQSLMLAKTLSDDLKTLSRKEGATLFMTLLAAFQTLLNRYTGQDDIVVGSPIANRTRFEIERLIGFFVNTMVLRTDLSSNPTFRELMARVRKVALDAYEHQDLPFEKIVEELKPERDLSHNPLFQVMFALQNVPKSEFELPGLSVGPIETTTGTAKFDLTLTMVETPDSLTASLGYNPDLFEDVTISRMLGHFQTLLQGIIRNPDQRISDLPILTETERHQLLVGWNDTNKDFQKSRCIHELFEAQVEQSPDSVAAVFEDRKITYRELNDRANQLAHHLRELGVEAEVLVGLCMERSLEMIVGLLGILKAGGAYVPIDPAYPKERVAFILKDAQTPVLITQQSLLEKLPSYDAKTVCLDSERDAIAGKSRHNPVTNATADNLAYVIYTSGSTGKPKGVAIEHHNTVTLLHWAKTIFTPEELTGVLASTSICFDLSVFELFVPLSWGGKVILAENALQLPTLVAGKDTTLINTVPSAIVELLRVGGVAPSVRTVNLAGEVLRTAVVKQIYEQLKVERVFDLYGPSEDTTYSTFALRSRRGPATIGRPITNTQIYLLDSHLQPVPVGVTGELHIGGGGLARCYLNRPDLTAEKFIANPFSDRPDARLYKTGDLARYLPDGKIEFLGRIDHQVKIRGFRIELGEIETVLGQHPAVAQTAVVVREDEPGDKRLVAYFVPERAPVPTATDLRSFLKQKLPEHMVPSAFVMLDILPLTPNGKVDRRALPAPDQRTLELETPVIAPSTPVEEALLRIWAEILKLEQVGIHDNFFDLGGHSLLATQVISRVREIFHIDLPLRAMFEAPTVASLAVQIAQIQAKEAVPEELADVESLSDEEAEKLLAQQGSKNT